MNTIEAQVPSRITVLATGEAIAEAVLLLITVNAQIKP